MIYCSLLVERKIYWYINGNEKLFSLLSVYRKTKRTLSRRIDLRPQTKLIEQRRQLIGKMNAILLINVVVSVAAMLSADWTLSNNKNHIMLTLEVTFIAKTAEHFAVLVVRKEVVC